MAVKTLFFQDDFVQILSQYALGSYIHAESIAEGTVQTNYFLHTTRGRLVFRYYENRSIESVRFETQLLAYLKRHAYPCPVPFKNTQGNYVGVYHDKPYVLYEFIAGQVVDHPNEQHKQQLIQKAAELQNLTRYYRPKYQQYRWNYSVDLCRTLARTEAAKIDTQAAQEKFAWLEDQLATLQLPLALPKGICHCDFHFTNVLFQEDRFAALLDFDDANHTFLVFDLVGLIEAWAWTYAAEALDLAQARAVVQEYEKHRPLNVSERRHLYDVYQLSILMDCVWYFGRGGPDDFYEKRKVDYLSGLGREKFFTALFHE